MNLNKVPRLKMPGGVILGLLILVGAVVGFAIVSQGEVTWDQLAVAFVGLGFLYLVWRIKIRPKKEPSPSPWWWPNQTQTVNLLLAVGGVLALPWLMEALGGAGFCIGIFPTVIGIIFLRWKYREAHPPKS